MQMLIFPCSLEGEKGVEEEGTMILMVWRLSRGLIPTLMMIFLNLRSKQAATGFPTGCTSSLTRSPDLLHDVIDLIYKIIIHQMNKKIKSKLDGIIFLID